MQKNELGSTIDLAQNLIKRPSISPNDAGCQEILKTRLCKKGFQITDLHFDDTHNLWATHGHGEPVFVFAGHTDVVPVGDESQWHTPPFSGEIIGDRLFGRGAADMKGSLSAMIVAAENFVTAHPNHNGTVAFLITSDEEDSGKNGTKRVVDWLIENQQPVTYCLVGEPSSTEKLGDVVKNGRRGSLIGYLRIFGIQGHVAYPHLAENPIHRALPFLTQLVNYEWDQGNEFFPKTSLQITNIHAGQGSTNVIPPYVDIQFNLRYSSELNHEIIENVVETLLKENALKYEIKWHLSGKPFFTAPGRFTNAVKNAVKNVTQVESELNTTGGTSDGRFIAQTGAEVVELGPINALIHKVNEWTSCEDLIKLEKIYQMILEDLLSK
ncbi:succinyl-diaminopimelate desuccinylase [Actinobacillus delphinicola]|uniref:succinyl-diaminopimelate desuccinylase n=1 Tax=Actinobacillus delphinicola TaxID=51161 RepID=UPI0024413505|nr:succinyl-diaminopimelate desuccinylase [Actinobacillus delphinicola]MDG6896660.1 succinyl-diaminopimelate desuccinylase [Actinobacillus delphinicola]